jgi:streptogramin lyase
MYCFSSVLTVCQSSFQLPGHILNRRRAHPPSYVKGKALRVQRVVGQKIQPLALHLAAASAGNPPNLHFEVHAGIATRQVAYPADLAVVWFGASLTHLSGFGLEIEGVEK